MNQNNYAVITGASTGLGKELAIECAKLGKDLILTALPGEKIVELSNTIIKNHHVSVFSYETDLTTQGSVESFAEWITGNFKINILINNAGIGGTKPFLDVSTGYIDRIVFLNMRVLVVLTHLLLPELKKHPKAYILNIASMASFGPMPFKTIYPASKAFVYSFSRGLNAELRKTGVVVSVAHPGGMKTNKEVTERIEKHCRLIQATTLPVNKVAKICIRQLLKGDELIIPGIMNKLSWILLKLIPVWLRLKIMGYSLQNEINLNKELVKPYLKNVS